MTEKGNIMNDISVLKPLHFIGKYLAILPNISLSNIEEYQCSYFYPAATITFIICMCIITTYERIIILPNTTEANVYIPYIAAEISASFSNISAIIGINMMNGKLVCQFLASLRKIDCVLRGVTTKCRTHTIAFWLELGISHIWFCVYAAYNLYLWWSALGWNVMKYFFLKDLNHFHLLATALIMRNYALAITFRLELLNNALCGVLRQEQSVYTIHNNVNLTPVNNFSVEDIRRLYTRMVEILQQYNKIFGWQFVTMYIAMILNLLTPIIVAIVYGNGEKEMIGYRFGCGLVFLCILWGSQPLIMGSLIFCACEKATREFAKTKDISYSLVQTLKSSEKHKTLKDQLQELAQQVTNMSPKFSAAGYFDVNHSLLFTLIGSITSYLIVLIQFNK